MEKKGDDKYFLIFKISNQILAVDVMYVIEIIGRQTITRVPMQTRFVRGVINLRGTIIPIIEISKLLEEEEKVTPKDCVIIVKKENELMGITINEVIEMGQVHILTITSNDIRQEGELITHVGQYRDKVVMVLNIDVLLENKIQKED